jgi:hypothetical protein
MQRYFDADLEQVRSENLKRMVRIWGGTTAMRKDECIACIEAGLANPEKVRAAIASLVPWERNALALIKRMGGVLGNRTLTVGLIASGFSLPSRNEYRRNNFANALLGRGLILATSDHNPDYINDSYGESMLYTDERLLAEVGHPEFLPLQIQPMATLPTQTLHRSPSTVILDVMGILQAIEKIGGLTLTQAGDIRANDEKKINKAMRWDEEGIKIDDYYFPYPIRAWVSAFRYSDLLQVGNDLRLTLKEAPESFAERASGEQVGYLMEGIIRSTAWSEDVSEKSYFRSYHQTELLGGRLALTLALSALPVNEDAFFSIEDFDQALFDRIGEEFSLDYRPGRPYFSFSSTAEQKKQELAQWRTKLRADWKKHVSPWLVSALTTWLYFLGLVELATENGALAGFRLTDLGRACFHPELRNLPLPAESESADQPVWVVQPNFDIVAYLDRASPSQLAFLERHAERKQTYQHTAQYRLTRESVYRGLESGTTLAGLLESLQAGFHNELPQNVAVELREWAALRERITLRVTASLLEFPTARDLQEAIAQGLSGKPVGERFLLLENAVDQVQAVGLAATRIDYAQSLPKHVTIAENGKIYVRQKSHDVIVHAQLDQWAERLADFEWQLSANSVLAQVKLGRKITELLGLLKERSTAPLPPLLEIALRSWAGEKHSVELDAVIVLHCPQEQLFQAILTSQIMRPFLKGYLPPSLFFIDKKQAATFRAKLDWLGCTVSDDLKIIPVGGSTQ